MKISKFFCMLIAGLAIIGFTTVGMASEEESKEATKATAEEEGAAKEESKAESKAEADEKEAKTEEKE